MESISLKKEIPGFIEDVVLLLTDKLKDQGFGVLTRIDLHKKIKEKLNKDIRPSIILGACNPQLAYEAFAENPDVAGVLPCNAVLRDIGDGKISVELAKPSSLMKILGDEKLISLSKEADKRLATALENL